MRRTLNMAEPLCSKEWDIFGYEETRENTTIVFNKEDVVSAVEWLKERIKTDKNLVISIKGVEGCGMSYLGSIIDKAFYDVSIDFKARAEDG